MKDADIDVAYRQLAAGLAQGMIPAYGHPFVGAIRERIGRMLCASPTYRQYLHHLDQGRLGLPNKNVLPWHAEGERLYAAGLLALAGTPGGTTYWQADEDGRPSDRAADAEAASWGIAYAVAALESVPYLWPIGIEDLADAAPLPKHVISRDVMPLPVMFWSRDVARVAPYGENNWMLLIRTETGIVEVLDIVVGEGDIRLTAAHLPFGKTYPDDFPEAVTREGVGAILARLAFLNSPYVAPESGRVPRQWRKEATRNALTAPLADPEIRVVQLRRDASERVERERQEAHAIEWKHQWWVSGHFRAQWYASEEAHKVIWIAPYLKGPSDKPIAKRVYAVTR